VAVTLLCLLVLLGVAYRATTPEERARLAGRVAGSVRALREATGRVRSECEPFRESLRLRTRWAVVTPAIAAVNALVFALMLLGDGGLADPETVLSWGGNLGTRTTNGEWWRLVTASFVNPGVLALAANLVGFVRVGFILERLVGHLAFAAVYLVAAVMASLVSLALYPVSISVGASGAIFGVYGLLLAVLVAIRMRRSSITVPLVMLKRLVLPAGVFVVFNFATAYLPVRAEMVGLLVGFAAGLGVALDVSDAKPNPRRVAYAVGATAAIVLLSAMPLRGLADVRPEINLVLAVEDHTKATYESAMSQFRKRQISADALAEMIETGIMPPLQAAQARLELLEHVPDEHQPLVTSAGEYLRLRQESWRLRAEGLRKTNMTRLREADRTEQASLNALQRVRSAEDP
jgi:membrane associated rhomboid family serine protease